MHSDMPTQKLKRDDAETELIVVVEITIALLLHTSILTLHHPELESEKRQRMEPNLVWKRRPETQVNHADDDEDEVNTAIDLS